MAGESNFLKLPFVRSLQQVGGQRAADAVQATTKGIPAQVVARNKQFVTVQFQMQTGTVGGPWTIVQADYPIAGSSSNDWYPVDVGQNGLLLPSDFYLGGVTGDGGGTADFAQRGNLAALAFHPLPQKAGDPPGGDTDKRILQGKNGVYLQSSDGSAKMTIDKTNGFKFEFGGHTVELNSSGLVIDGIIFETHEHINVTAGTDKTGGPTNP